MCGVTSDLVICKFSKSTVIHDTECPYWDQVSLNNTNTNPSLVVENTVGLFLCMNMYMRGIPVYFTWDVNSLPGDM